MPPEDADRGSVCETHAGRTTSRSRLKMQQKGGGPLLRASVSAPWLFSPESFHPRLPI